MPRINDVKREITVARYMVDCMADKSQTETDHDTIHASMLVEHVFKVDSELFSISFDWLFIHAANLVRRIHALGYEAQWHPNRIMSDAAFYIFYKDGNVHGAN